MQGKENRKGKEKGKGKKSKEDSLRKVGCTDARKLR